MAVAGVNVLVTSTPGLGHIHPLVPIAQALRDDGHEVTWAVAPSACEPLARLGFRCLPAGFDQAVVRARLLEREPDFLQRVLATPPRERRRFLLLGFMADGAVSMLADLPALIDEVGAEVVVHEPNAFAAPAAAAARGIPHVTVGYGGLIPDELLDLGVDALAALWGAVGFAAPTLAGLYEHLYLHPSPPSLGAVPAGRNIVPVRPLGFDGADDPPPPDWLAGRGRERPLVYATFGTEIAALAPVAAVVGALGRLDVDAVLTVGPRTDPASIVDAPANVRLERYVPQRLVLRRASLLVSHAGSGAVLGAAAHGVPQLCLPVAADQFENADAVVASGAGLALDPDQVAPEAIAEAATKLLGGTPFAAASARLADEIASMPLPADHVARIEALAG
jgi:UDP:flavonoid glycosyltransferase YjiC (YdhE family)